MGKIAGQNNNMVNATDFAVSDVVKSVSQDLAANHVGVVTHILPKSNKVNVQWAWGNKSESPETLIKVPKDWYPPSAITDTSYSTWETDKSEKMFGKLPSNRRASIASKIALRFTDKEAAGLKSEKWLDHKFESSSTKTPEFKQFARDFLSDIKKVCDGYEIVEKSVGHFYVSGFLKKEGKYFYFSISDVRSFPGEWFNNILVRTAKNEKDYTGGSNNYAKLTNLKDKLDYLFKSE